MAGRGDVARVFRAILLLAALLLSIITPHAGRATGLRAKRFVATSGSDSSTGSSSQPWRTIQHAVDNALPGNVIVVRAGTYSGARIEQSGQSGARIVLRAVKPGKVLLDRPGNAARHGSTLEIENFDADVSYWTIKGFDIVGGARSGVDIRIAHHITVLRNRVWGSGRTGIFTAFADDIRVLRNESFDNGEHGVYTSNSGDRPVIRDNKLHDNAASGLHMNGDLSAGGDGVISGARVDRNTIYGNGDLGGSGINMDGVDGALVSNNLLYDEHASGISLFRGDGAICTSNTRVFHNTVVVAADGRWALNAPDPGCVNNRLFNNIFFTGHSFRGSIDIAQPAPPGFESNHNVVMNRFSIDGGNTVIDVAAWRARGYGASSIVSSPAQVFVSVADDNYELRAGSPARDVGRKLGAVKRDLRRRKRPSCGGADIGALESACARRR